MNRLLRLALVLLAALPAAGCRGDAGKAAAAPAPETWGGPGRTPGRFYRPRAVAVNAGRVYVVDMSGRIQALGLDGKWLATWDLPETSRGYPTGLGVRPDGAIAVADTHNYVVRIYAPDGREIRRIGREGGGPGEFTYVTDVKFDKEGCMYVSEHGRQDRIQKFDRDGGLMAAWGRAGERHGEFRRPEALAVDAAGAVYVADAANHRVQKFSPDGRVLAVWGEPGRGPGQLLYPYGLALTPDGRLLVCEYGNNRVQAFDGEGRSAGIWGTAGRGPGELAAPRAVAWVPDRGILVADTDNHRLQLFRVGKGTRF